MIVVCRSGPRHVRISRRNAGARRSFTQGECVMSTRRTLALGTFAILGMPAVNYGPGDPEVAHSVGEHVPLTQIAKQVRSGVRLPNK